MKRVRTVVFVLLILIAVGCADQRKNRKNTTKAPPPNILFIMTDDHAYQAISSYDNRLIQTPNIDRLAAEGVRFENSFVSNSVSSPSRAVCLTGKFSHENGLRDNHTVFDSAQQTFPKILREAGYETAVVGKWHLKSEPTGFDHWQVLPDQGEYYHPQFLTPDGTITKQGYVTDIITNSCLEWLAHGRDTSKPFLLMCQHKAPHREWLPPPKYCADPTATSYVEPATLFDDYAGRGEAARSAEMRIADHMGLSSDNKIPPEMVAAMGYREFLPWYPSNYEYNLRNLSSEEREAWTGAYRTVAEDFAEQRPEGEALTRWKYQRYMQDYLACIRSVDDNIGRLYQYLEANGLLDNTLVVYASDQGFYLGEHGWFDKRFMYEESFRTPLIMRLPTLIQPGSVETRMVQNIDYAATLLDVAGLPIPPDMQGESLLPLLRNEPVAWREALYYHYYEYPGIHAVKRHYGVRTDRYKLIHFYYDIDQWELYDLLNDPLEMTNVFSEPEYADVVVMMKERLQRLQQQYGDSEALRNAILEADLKRL